MLRTNISCNVVIALATAPHHHHRQSPLHHTTTTVSHQSPRHHHRQSPVNTSTVSHRCIESPPPLVTTSPHRHHRQSPAHHHNRQSPLHHITITVSHHCTTSPPPAPPSPVTACFQWCTLKPRQTPTVVRCTRRYANTGTRGWTSSSLSSASPSTWPTCGDSRTSATRTAEVSSDSEQQDAFPMSMGFVLFG